MKLSSNKITNFFIQYVLPIGLLVFLTGLFFLPSRTTYASYVYALMFTPSLIIFAFSFKEFKHLLNNKIIISVSIFLLYSCLSVFWSDSDRSVLYYLKHNIYILIFLLSFGILFQKNQRSLSAVLLVSCLVASSSAIFCLFETYIIGNHPFSFRITGQTSIGALDHILFSGYVYGFFAAFVIAYLLNKKLTRIQIWVGWVTLIPLIIYLVMTHSRTPIVALFSALLINLFLKLNKRNVIILACTLASFLLLVLFFPDRLLEAGFSYRPLIWKETFEMILNNPWFGHGMANSYSVPIKNSTVIIADPHNAYLFVLYYFGIIGAFLWVTVYFVAYKPLIEARDDWLARLIILLLTHGVVTIAIGGGPFFINRPKEVWFLVWLPLAMAAMYRTKNHAPTTKLA